MTVSPAVSWELNGKPFRKDTERIFRFWIQRYTEFVAAKAGLASAPQSADNAHQTLRAHYYQRMGPVLQTLVQAATAADAIRADVSAVDVGTRWLCCASRCPARGPATAGGLVNIFIDGLRP